MSTTVRRSAILLAGAVALALVALAARAPATEGARALAEHFRESGAVGLFVYALLYLAATAALLPAAVLTLWAGYAYGPVAGTFLVLPVATTAATFAFLLGRTIGRPWVARRLGGDPRLAAADEAIGRDGRRIVFLLRLSPIFPFSVLNYALSLTRVRLRDYVLATSFGMLPGTVL